MEPQLPKDAVHAVATVDVIELLDDDTDGQTQHNSTAAGVEHDAAIYLLSEDDDSSGVAAAQQLPSASTEKPKLQLLGPRSQWKPAQQHTELFIVATEERNSNRVLADIYNISLTGTLLQMLLPGQWLGDEVINAYLTLLQMRDYCFRFEPGSDASKCYFLNSFFINKLYSTPPPRQYRYEQVASWSVPALPFGLEELPMIKCERLITVLHKDTPGCKHWAAAMIDLANKQLVVCDSLGFEHHDVVHALQRWVEDEAKVMLPLLGLEYTPEDWAATSWPVLHAYPDIPRQDNGCDCGVFAAMYCNRLALGIPFDFTQEDAVTDLRVRLAHDLVKKIVDATEVNAEWKELHHKGLKAGKAAIAAAQQARGVVGPQPAVQPAAYDSDSDVHIVE